jgi:hypothetical protein
MNGYDLVFGLAMFGPVVAVGLGNLARRAIHGPEEARPAEFTFYGATVDGRAVWFDGARFATWHGGTVRAFVFTAEPPADLWPAAR